MIDPETKLETSSASTEAGASSAEVAGVTSTMVRTPINPDDLHDLFEGSPSETDPEDPFAQMRNDPNYAALIKDLEAIAEAARQMFATEEEEPSDKVWNNIVGKLGEKPE
jgi:hypothetical protein